MRKECAEGLRREPVADDDARRTAALEILIAVFVFLAAGERDDLGGDVRKELLLARAALDVDVDAALALPEADEL